MAPTQSLSGSIRWAVPADAEALARLSDELRSTSGDPTGALTPEIILRDGFGATPEFEVLVATDAETVTGYALFYESYEPSKAARGLYLADLCVAAIARRRGTGRALFDAVAREAGERGRTFVWWLSHPSNTGAAAFYDAIQPDITVSTVARVRSVHPDI